MLEGIVAAYLAKYLEKYILNFNKENLKFSLSSGDVALENLALRPDALIDLDLPITVIGGFLGKLSLSIPWKQLSSKPAVIRFEKIYLLAGPKVLSEFDETEEKREQYTKKKRVELAEMFVAKNSKNKDKDKKEKKEDDNSVSNWMLTKIMDNIQIFIDKIHIRYEDTRADSLHPFVMGITLEHLNAQTTNDQWVPSFIDTKQKLIHKLVDLKNFVVYWDYDSEPLSFNSSEEMGKKLEEMIYQSGRTKPFHRYILEPIYGELKVIVNKSSAPDLKIPKYTLNFCFEKKYFFCIRRKSIS